MAGLAMANPTLQYLSASHVAIIAMPQAGPAQRVGEASLAALRNFCASKIALSHCPILFRFVSQ